MFKFFIKFLTVLIIGAIIFVMFNRKSASKDFEFSDIGVSTFEKLRNVFLENTKAVKNLQDMFLSKNNNDGSDLNSKEQRILEALNNDKILDEERDYTFNGTEDQIITLINKERFDRDLKPLKKNSFLMKSALDKAEDMKKHKYFEHISEYDLHPWFFAERAGYQYQRFGENIATKYTSANSVHKAFMDSIGHRDNILEEDFRDVGVAVVLISDKNAEKSEYIIVEHFGHYLKNIDIDKEDSYGKKSEFRCKTQRDKNKELKSMMGNCQRDIESFNKEEEKFKEEFIGRQNDLEIIKNKIEKYLDVCEELEGKYR